MTLTEKVAALRVKALSSAPPSERSTVNDLFDFLHNFTTEYESMTATLGRIEAALHRIERAVGPDVSVADPECAGPALPPGTVIR